MALKEWAVVVKALKEGKQIMLLRKGGIAEEEGEFRVEHREFFLYPTFSHQEEQYIRPPFFKDFEAVQETQDLWGKVRIDAYAIVEEVLDAKDLERLHKLEEHHIWTPSQVARKLVRGIGRPLLIC